MDTFVDCVPVTFSINEIDVLNKAFRDKNFRKQFEDFARQICDPKNLNHFESELKKFEKERGVDVNLLQPSPGISLFAKTSENSENVCLNISVSGKIEKPNFTYAEENFDRIKLSVPHAVLKPRLELDMKALVDGSIVIQNNDIKQEYLSAARRDGVWVYEIVVNQVCIDLAKSTESLRDHIISIAKESIKNKLKVELKDEKFLGYDIYIGKSTISQLKSVENSELYNNNSNSVKNFCSKKNENQKDFNFFGENIFIEKFADTDKDCKIKPWYKLKHVDHVTLQDYSIIRNEYPSSLKSQSLLLEIKLPGITSVSDIDVDIIRNKEFHLKSKNGIEYNLDLNLPYDVEEEPLRAKFHVSTSLLEIELKVIKYCSQISFDSGVECDNTYRTSSDNDNSSVSSNEENDLKSIVDSDEKVSTFQFNQGDQYVYLSMDSDNINAESIKLNIIDSFSFLCSFEKVNKECNILYILVDPNSIKENGITHFLLGQTVWIQMEKSKPKMWSKLKVKTYCKEDIMDVLENETATENIIKKSVDKSFTFDINCDPALIPKIFDPENKENTESLPDNQISDNNLLSNENNQQDRNVFIKPLLPECIFSQSQNYLTVNIPCGNIDIRNIMIESINSKMFHFQYKLIGKGCTPLFYGGYICTSPYAFKTNGISHNIRDNSISIIVEKKKLSSWQKVDEVARKDDELKTEEISKAVSDFDHSDECAEKSLKGKENLDIRNKLNECQKSSEIDIPNSSRKTNDCFVTGSWPRGILKSRSRSLSDSHIHSNVDVVGNNDFFTSVDCEDDDFEMSEENELQVGSSPKKSVRFNEFVSKQEFKVNSSIIGQKVKNQKKAQQRKRARERKLSEGSQSSGTDTVTEQSDVTSEEESNNDVERETKSSKKGNPSNRNKMSSRKKREKLNKKNRKNRKPSLSLSNEMIFQLDD
ncbi:Protein kintoun [Armadillidium vulgare]|nr:Protein kintoun [Armadillidium vulgare]